MNKDNKKRTLGTDSHGHMWRVDATGAVWTTGYRHYEERPYKFVAKVGNEYVFEYPDGERFRRIKKYEHTPNSIHDGWKWEEVTA